MELRTIATYQRAVRSVLPDTAFEPARSRLLWLPFHTTVIVAIAWWLAAGDAPAWIWPIASIVIGVCMAAVAFLGHEILHGGIVRGRVAIRLLGWICLVPFTVSPTLWTAWHNRVHHNHCAQPGKDPDMYPTLAEYEADPFARLMADYFGLGGRRIASVIGLLLGFTGQSQQMLWEAQKHGILTRTLQLRAIVETLLGVAFWACVALAAGAAAFLFIYVIPLVVANVIVMMFILTNHSLNAATPTVNDPLVNSLSVTLPRPLEWLSLGFGYHVEHHVFPAMSTRHAPLVRDALRAQFGDQYQAMPLPRALAQLYATGRVYKDDTTLIEPRSGETSKALGAPR